MDDLYCNKTLGNPLYQKAVVKKWGWGGKWIFSGYGIHGSLPGLHFLWSHVLSHAPQWCCISINCGIVVGMGMSQVWEGNQCQHNMEIFSWLSCGLSPPPGSLQGAVDLPLLYSAWYLTVIVFLQELHTLPWICQLSSTPVRDFAPCSLKKGPDCFLSAGSFLLYLLSRTGRHFRSPCRGVT